MPFLLWAKTNLPGYLIKSNLVFTSSGKEVKTEGEFILSKDNKTWTSLTKVRDGVTLLGKIVAADGNSIHLEYIVIDTSKASAVISTPAILAKLGETAEIYRCA